METPNNLLIAIIFVLIGCGQITSQGNKDIPYNPELRADAPSGLNQEPSGESVRVEGTSSGAVLGLSFSKLRNLKGDICYSVFKGADGFPKDEKKAQYFDCMPANADSGPTFEIEPGQSYGVAVFHDENKNRKLDTTGPLKIPTEGIGFSNNPKIAFGPPRYSAVDFISKAGLQVKTLKFFYLL